MALSLGDLNKKNPARKPPKTADSQSVRKLMPWESIEDKNEVTSNQQVTKHNETLPADLPHAVVTETNQETTSNLAVNPIKEITPDFVSVSTKEETIQKPTSNKPVTNEANYIKDTSYDISEEAISFQEITSNQIKEPTSNKQETEETKPVTEVTSLTSVTSKKEVPQTGRVTRNIRKPTSSQLVTPTSVSHGFQSIVGLQRQIVLVIYTECIRARDKVTPPITIGHFAQICGKTAYNEIETLKKSIIKLQHKGIIHRVEFKNGRGGWTRYELEKSIFDEIRDAERSNQLVTNGEPSYTKPHSQVVTKTVTEPPSSSITHFSLIEETTTSSQSNLPPEWLRIDISCLQDIGFTGAHLKQLSSQSYLTPTQVQDCINYFAFDLEYNNKRESIKGNALNYFMGILRKGIPYTPPDNYESERDRVLRQYLEAKRKEREKRQSMEKELLEFELDVWLDQLSVEEKKSLVQEQSFMKVNSTAHNEALSSYYRENIWPEVVRRLRGEVGF